MRAGTLNVPPWVARYSDETGGTCWEALGMSQGACLLIPNCVWPTDTHGRMPLIMCLQTGV